MIPLHFSKVNLDNLRMVKIIMNAVVADIAEKSASHKGMCPHRRQTQMCQFDYRSADEHGQCWRHDQTEPVCEQLV